jgi:hypothetical protein
MKWNTLFSTLVGALITYSAILFTNALDLRKRKRAHEQLIHALLQGLHDEIAGLLEMATSARPMGPMPDGKPYEGLFTAHQDYFTVYHANAALVMQIEDAELRRSNASQGMVESTLEVSLRFLANNPLQPPFGFKLIGPAGQSVVIETSADLQNWMPFQTNLVPANGILAFTDSDSAASRQRFFRGRVE